MLRDLQGHGVIGGVWWVYGLCRLQGRIFGTGKVKLLAGISHDIIQIEVLVLITENKIKG